MSEEKTSGTFALCHHSFGPLKQIIMKIGLNDIILVTACSLRWFTNKAYDILLKHMTKIVFALFKKNARFYLLFNNLMNIFNESKLCKRLWDKGCPKKHYIFNISVNKKVGM